MKETIYHIPHLILSVINKNCQKKHCLITMLLSGYWISKDLKNTFPRFTSTLKLKEQEVKEWGEHNTVGPLSLEF